MTPAFSFLQLKNISNVAHILPHPLLAFRHGSLEAREA